MANNYKVDQNGNIIMEAYGPIREGWIKADEQKYARQDRYNHDTKTWEKIPQGENAS